MSACVIIMAEIASRRHRSGPSHIRSHVIHPSSTQPARNTWALLISLPSPQRKPQAWQPVKHPTSAVNLSHT